MKKAVILVVVMGILIVVFTLALVALYLMTQEARIAEHKIRRMEALFAARAAMVHAIEELRSGNTNLDPSWTVTMNRIGPGAVTITYNAAATGPGNTHQVDVTVQYR